VVAQTATTSDGTYEVSATPERNVTVHAQWGAAFSPNRTVHVRPRLTGRRGSVRLFASTVVRGHLAPWHAGSPIDVTLWRNGNPVAHLTPRLSPHGAFQVKVPIEQPGSHRVVVHFQDADHTGVTWRSKPETTPLPTLYSGSRGPFVQAVERRLADLGYRVYAQDPEFDYHDSDSVLAFHKVQGMALTGVVDRATWHALAQPKELKVLGSRQGTHWEVNLTKQVLYLLKDGVPQAIIHISSGKPSTPTHAGSFHVWSKQAGTNSKGMYYSSFFDGNRATHGYYSVPSYAASHGCVRMPDWTAVWVYDRSPIGIGVLVHY
jgi:hypothetical protein